MSNNLKEYYKVEDSLGNIWGISKEKIIKDIRLYEEQTGYQDPVEDYEQFFFDNIVDIMYVQGPDLVHRADVFFDIFSGFEVVDE